MYINTIAHINIDITVNVNINMTYIYTVAGLQICWHFVFWHWVPVVSSNYLAWAGNSEWRQACVVCALDLSAHLLLPTSQEPTSPAERKRSVLAVMAFCFCSSVAVWTEVVTWNEVWSWCFGCVWHTQGLKLKKKIRMQTKEVADHGWPKALTSRTRVDTPSFKAEGARSTPPVHQQLLRHAALCYIDFFTVFFFHCSISTGCLASFRRAFEQQEAQNKRDTERKEHWIVTSFQKKQQEPPRPRSLHEHLRTEFQGIVGV